MTNELIPKLLFRSTSLVLVFTLGEKKPTFLGENIFSGGGDSLLHVPRPFFCKGMVHCNLFIHFAGFRAMPVPFHPATSPSNSSSTAASSYSPAHNVEVSLRENRGSGGRGMTRSSASYGIQQLLQEQVNRRAREERGKAAMMTEIFFFFFLLPGICHGRSLTRRPAACRLLPPSLPSVRGTTFCRQ